MRVSPWYKQDFETTVNLALDRAMAKKFEDKVLHLSVVKSLPDAVFLVPEAVNHLENMYRATCSFMDSDNHTRQDNFKEYVNSRIASATKAFQSAKSKIPHYGYGKYETALIEAELLPQQVEPTFTTTTELAMQKQEIVDKGFGVPLANIFDDDYDNNEENNMKNQNKQTTKKEIKRQPYTTLSAEVLKAISDDNTPIANMFESKDSKFLKYLTDRGIVTLADYAEFMKSLKNRNNIAHLGFRRELKGDYICFKNNFYNYCNKKMGIIVDNEPKNATANETKENQRSQKPIDVPEIHYESKANQKSQKPIDVPEIHYESKANQKSQKPIDVPEKKEKTSTEPVLPNLKDIDDLNSLDESLFVKGSQEIEAVYEAVAQYLNNIAQTYVANDYAEDVINEKLKEIEDRYKQIVDNKRAIYEEKQKEAEKRATMSRISARIKTDVRYKHGQPNNHEYKHQHNPYLDDPGMTF